MIIARFRFRRGDPTLSSDTGAPRNKAKNFLALPEARLLILGALSLILLGPLRGLLSAAPVFLFLAALVLFSVPGMTLTYLLMDRRFSVMERAPTAFAFSIGVFGLAAFPGLLMDWSLGTYLWVCCGMLALSVILLGVTATPEEPSSESEESSEGDPSGRWLWAPFAVVGGVTGYLAWAAAPPKPVDDFWIYLAYVRDYLSTNRLASQDPFYGGELGFSRIQINGWLAEQAMLSRLTGIDPVVLAMDYLTPVLVLAGLLAVYALARVLFENRRAALVVASLNALLQFLWSAFRKLAAGEAISFNAQSTFDKATFDKVISLNLLLPIALIFVALFLKEREWRYLALFTLACWSAVVVHPIGLAAICFAAAGFGLGYLAFRLRDRAAWVSVACVGAAPLTVILPPAIFLLVAGDSVAAERGDFADIYNTVPGVIGYLAFIGDKPNFIKFADGSYMVSPRQLLGLGLILAYPLGIPFLLWRAIRRSSVTAQMLLGVLAFATPLLYIPPIATFLGEYTGPSQLLRINESIRLTAILILGWILWETLKYITGLLGNLEPARRVAGYLPLILVGLLTAAFAYYALEPEIGSARARPERAAAQTAQQQSAVRKPLSCTESVFRWIRANAEPSSVVLTRDPANNCVPAYSASSNVVSLRGTQVINAQQNYERALGHPIEIPRRAKDVQTFSESREVSPGLVQILSRYGVDYVLVRSGSPLAASMEGYAGDSLTFTKTDAPDETLALYKVDGA